MILLGVVASWRRGGPLDFCSTLLALGGYSVPVFWLGQMLIVFVALQLDWLPAQGMRSLRAAQAGWGYLGDLVRHLILPAVTLGAWNAALVTRMTRASMLEALDQDFVRTARAMGVPERRVVLRHALRNALLPVITVIGSNLGVLVGGALLTETVFAWPGLGRLMLEAILARDFPLLMGLFIFTATTILVINFLTDLAYALLDPRVQYR